MIKRSDIDELSLDEAREVQSWLLSRIVALEQIAAGPAIRGQRKQQPSKTPAAPTEKEVAANLLIESIKASAREETQRHRERESAKRPQPAPNLPTKEQSIAMFKGLFK